MAEPPPTSTDGPTPASDFRSASEIFAEFLGRRERGEDVDIRDVLGAHPDLAGELQQYYSDAGHHPQLREDAALAAPEHARPLDAVLAVRSFAECVVPGQSLGGFVLRRRIAKGGMGQVWEAEQTSLGRTVALKVIRPDRLSPRALALFSREARAIARLKHPNIVPIYTHDTTGGVPWIAMEYVEGGRTLRELQARDNQRAPMSDTYACLVAEVFLGITDAMAAAHECEVVHRDLKLENVLLDKQDRPRVTDFGLAKLTDEISLSSAGERVGTLRYMSPEQIEGRREDIDRRSDVFSLGAMLYEVLAHRPAFEGSSMGEIEMHVTKRDPPYLDAVRQGLPRELALITHKCLEKRPERRYATMVEVNEELRRFLAREPVRARPALLFNRFQTLAVVCDDHSQRVLRCLDTKLQREVILEAPGWSTRLPPTIDGKDRALREAEVLAALDCAGLPRVHDVLSDEFGLVLVLESVGGESLASRLKRTGALSPGEVRRLARELAQTLSKVHASRAVHRGLSTECVLLRTDGSAMLRGFRFAKFTPPGYAASSLYSDRTRARTSADLRAVLPRHPAPEQFGGTQASAMTDLFALGCVLYEAAAGRPAFEDHYGAEYRAPTPLRHVAPGLHPQLAAVIEQCLARSAAGRPSSMQAVHDLLQPEHRRRHWLIGLAVSLAAILLLVLAVWAGQRWL